MWSNGGGIWWSSSTDRGASFVSPVRLTEQDGVTHLHVGAGGDGGFAGFRTLDGRVWVVPLEEAGAPPPPPDTSPDTSITLEVGAERKQKVKQLEVTVSCGDEACEAALAGRAVAKKKGAGKGRRAAAAKKRGKKTFKVKPKALSLTAGETKTQRVRFKRNKKSVRKVRKLLKRKAYRRKTKAKLKVSATDAAGNAATERVKVKLRR